MVNRHRVGQLDAVVLVQHHHAIGHGFAGIDDEALQRAAQCFLRHGLLAALPVQRRKHILPTAHAFRGALGRGVSPARPAALVQVIQMKAQANQRRQQCQRQADGPAKQQRRQRRCRANAASQYRLRSKRGRMHILTQSKNESCLNFVWQAGWAGAAACRAAHKTQRSTPGRCGQPRGRPWRAVLHGWAEKR